MAGAAEAGPSSRTRRAALPKVFYTSRTHSQIAQVVAELKRAPYTPRAAVLASREHYCVHPAVSASSGRDEACERLLRGDGGGCAYFKGVGRLLAPGAAPDVHDVEELAAAGRRHKACPYYASRQLAGATDGGAGGGVGWPRGAWRASAHPRPPLPHPSSSHPVPLADADIVFAPYAYLLDPCVRAALDVDLAGAVVVVDEAHNVEDMCRRVRRG